MKASRSVVMGVAAVAAILLAFLVRGMIAGNGAQEAKATTEKAPAVATARVLIATRELKAGTRLSEGDLTWQEWPVTSLNPAYIVDGGMPAGAPGTEGTTPAKEGEKPKGEVADKVSDVTQAVADKIAPSPTKEAYVGGVAREDILANEPIIDAKIVRADEGGFMAVMLRPGMRALAVPVSVDNTAGGFILPGDRVDFLVTHQTPSASGRGTIDSVQPVLRNIRVLAIDQSVAAEQDKQSVIGATATLEVSPNDGQVVTLAKASGTLSLMLRSYADAQGPSGAVTMVPTGGAQGDQPVRDYRNGQATEVTVSR